MYVLHRCQSLADPLLDLVRDDPVRPHISREFRVQDSNSVWVLLSLADRQPCAVVCTALRDTVPASELELLNDRSGAAVAVFYTIWSYQPGSGRALLRSVCEQLAGTVSRFVTLSPTTEMARVFHLRNGARVLQVNQDTVNYEYS